jgi:hypothetical protein
MNLPRSVSEVGREVWQPLARVGMTPGSEPLRARFDVRDQGALSLGASR